MLRVVAISRWMHAEVSVTEKLFKTTMPWYIVRYVIKPNVAKFAHAQGMARHTKEQVQHTGELDLDALSRFIGTADKLG